MTSHLERVTYYYSLVFKGVKVYFSFCRMKFRSIWYQSDNGFIMGQLSSRPNKASNECILEPCTLLSYTTNTAENQPQWVDETPVGSKSDGGREEKRTRFWKWPALSFPRSAKYDLVQAEKDYQNESGLYRKHSNTAPTSEVQFHPAAEEQLKQVIIDNGMNNKSMRIRKCYFKLLYER